MQAEAVIQFLSVVTVIFFETTRLLFRSHQAHFGAREKLPTSTRQK
jgi:hypothetical protein